MADDPHSGVTLLRPEASAAHATFPTDLFEESYRRLRFLAGFFAVAFGFDTLIWLGSLGWTALWGQTFQVASDRSNLISWINVGSVSISIVVFWAVGRRRISPSRLQAVGIVYEIVICFTSATLTFWQYYLDTGSGANLTWVPAIVIMFPLIMPGPPLRMLGGAIASAATAPLGLLALDLSGNINVGEGDAYVSTAVGSVFAVLFAYVGAKEIYGLGREVAKARALGSYQLVERLGSGGMGEVWRARHRLLARPAAVKLIHPSFTQNVGTAREFLKRFEREAQSIAALRSPHTVDLFDFGVADNGTYYYAMELLDGLDADALVRRFGPIPAERVVHIVRQVCHSLSEAEYRGLVHRDIKPANIFLCQYGEDYDFVKVLDFGIVKTLHESETAQTALTAGNAIHGTPAFMAPEQALGETDIDVRADIYALGCVAYWLLTGSLVFTAEAAAALLVKHIQSPPSPPSAATELPIPRSLDAIVLSCLAKNPADRPQSAKDLSIRLAGVEGADAWTPERRRDWWDTHRPVPSVALGRGRKEAGAKTGNGSARSANSPEEAEATTRGEETMLPDSR